MNYDEFGDISNVKTKNNLFLSSKMIAIIVFVLIIVVLAALYFGFFSHKKNSGSLKLDDQIILYMGGDSFNLSVKLDDLKVKDMNDVLTSYYSESEDIISLADDEFSGNRGSIVITPLSIGTDNINFVSAYGVDKYTKILDTKTVHVVVCPKLDKSLLNKSTINVKKGNVEKINLNFSNELCFKNITYASQNSNIATIDKNGVISGIERGRTIIRVFSTSNSFTIVVNVY